MLTSAIIRRRRRSGGALSLTDQLLASGAVFQMIDPLDTDTIFQDNGTSTPVTADGQVLGRILDKSGNGYHHGQSSATLKPLWKTDGSTAWIAPDGTNDYMDTGTPQAITCPQVHTHVALFEIGTIAAGSTSVTTSFVADAVIVSGVSQWEMGVYNNTSEARLRSKYPSIDTAFVGAILTSYTSPLLLSVVRESGTSLKQYEAGVLEQTITTASADFTNPGALRLFKHTNAAQYSIGKLYRQVILSSSDPALRILAEAWCMEAAP